MRPINSFSALKAFDGGTGLIIGCRLFSDGGTIYNGSPWPKHPHPQSRAAGSLAHPFVRKWAAMLAFGKRSPTRVLTLGRKHIKSKVMKKTH